MRKTTFFVLLLIFTPLILAGCLMAGAFQLGIPDLNTLAGSTIFRLRIYRVLAGFSVGAALACAGVVMQALLRNPLAEPYVLGVSSGAGLGAALAIVTGITGFSVFALPGVAFAGAVLTLLLVYKLAESGGRISIYGLILSGVIVSSICSNILMFIVVRSSSQEIHGIMWWMLGNLEPHSQPLQILTSAIIGAGILVLWIMSVELNALSLGQEMAHYVGVRTKLATGVGLSVATLIAAAAVALAGLIGFIGLVVPHVVRKVIGPDHRGLIPASAVVGGLFLVICDALARTVAAPIELPVGVFSALVGGPFFLMILRSRRKGGWFE